MGYKVPPCRAANRLSVLVNRFEGLSLPRINGMSDRPYISLTYLLGWCLGCHLSQCQVEVPED